MKKLIIGACLLFFINPLSAETISLDNSEIQTWHGMTGRWIEIGSMSDLDSISKRFSTTVDAIRKANGDVINSRSYIFVPFGEEYMASLSERGITRSEVESGSVDYIWPMQNVDKISSSFGYRGGELHEGVDLPKPQGTPVLAARDGRVIFVGYAGGHGRCILLEHRDNFFTRYSHNSVLLVKKGDLVRKGQVIGYVGSTGHSTGNHLHFEIRYGEIPLDPVDFLPVRDDIVQSHSFRGKTGLNR